MIVEEKILRMMVKIIADHTEVVIDILIEAMIDHMEVIDLTMIREIVIITIISKKVV